MSALRAPPRARGPAATTSGGAFRTKFSLPSLALRLAQIVRFVLRDALGQTLDFGRRVDSPAIGTSSVSSPTMARGRLRARLAGRRAAVMLSRPASRSRYARWRCDARGIARADAFCSSSGSCARARCPSRRGSGARARMNCLIQATSRFRLGIAGEIRGGRVGARITHVDACWSRALRPATAARQRMHALPDLFGDERHQRMQRAQQRFEHRHQRAARAALLRLGGGFALQHGLGELEVPVAELVPGEFVQRRGGEVEAILAQRAIDLRERRGRSARRSSGRRRRARAAPPRSAPAVAFDRHQSRSAPRSTACCRSCGSRRRGRGRS